MASEKDGYQVGESGNCVVYPGRTTKGNHQEDFLFLLTTHIPGIKIPTLPSQRASPPASSTPSYFHPHHTPTQRTHTLQPDKHKTVHGELSHTAQQVAIDYPGNKNIPDFPGQSLVYLRSKQISRTARIRSTAVRRCRLGCLYLL